MARSKRRKPSSINSSGMISAGASRITSGPATSTSKPFIQRGLDEIPAAPAPGFDQLAAEQQALAAQFPEHAEPFVDPAQPSHEHFVLVAHAGQQFGIAEQFQRRPGDRATQRIAAVSRAVAAER